VALPELEGCALSAVLVDQLVLLVFVVAYSLASRLGLE